ncbi:MAG: LytTR family transcriptional regulator [Marinifilaceae bacterium]|jgi:hypothetical protein|nr:LytTR family transcriptional regulator [Marinifilaceae bacterium]
MNKDILVFFRKFTNFLSQPYPFYYRKKNLLIIAGLLFAITFLFNYFIEPFVVYTPEHKINFFWISVIHAFILVVIIGLLGLIRTNSETDKNWNIQKEILLISLFLLLVGISQFLIRDIIYNNPNNWSWKYFNEEIKHSFLLGSIFAIVLTSLNHNRKAFKFNKNKQSVKLADTTEEKASISTINIKTKVKTDAFNLNIDKFLFAKSDGNYVELFINEDKLNKIVKRISLKELESKLVNYPNIFKTHRSYLVNLKYVEKVVGNAQGYKLKLSNYDETVPVSRNKVQEFDTAIKKP